MPTVLVVDDDVNLCEAYRQELEYQGYDVVTAHSGQDALGAVDEHDIDVVVLDIAMPGMDGIEALAKLLSKDRQLPVILNTAYRSYQDDFMTWAAEAYLTKSADMDELVAAIDEALRKREIPPPELADSGPEA